MNQKYFHWSSSSIFQRTFRQHSFMSECYWIPKYSLILDRSQTLFPTYVSRSQGGSTSLISSNTVTPKVSSHVFPELRSSSQQDLLLSKEEVWVPFSLLFLAPLCCRGTAASLRNWWQFSSPLPLRRPPSQHTVRQRARPKIWNLQLLWDVFISIALQTTTFSEHSPPESKIIELT